jgi:flavin-dependent dehydrogenase
MRNRPSSKKTIAIIGGGPGGAALGNLLCKQGHKVVIFQLPKRPPLIVGESLLPAVVPILRELGIEEEVKSFSVYKPGATVCLSLEETIYAPFNTAASKVANYAYNTPRDLFDAAVLRSAVAVGAKVFDFAAQLEKGNEPMTIRLSDETLAKTEGYLEQQPDLIVDATGRARTISHLLDIPIRKGGREDVALFAHLDKCDLIHEGHIHLNPLSRGWSWRIPLPGRTSLGIVINPEHLKPYGQTIEEQYDNFLKDEPALKVYTANSKRVTPVVRYNNYQVVLEKLHGPNWTCVGDAAGFIDPVLSTGLYLSMRDSGRLAKAINAGTPAAMQQYEDNRQREIRRWQGIIATWYDGRLNNLYRAGVRFRNRPFAARVEARVQRRLATLFSGAAADHLHQIAIYKGLMKLSVALRDPTDLAIV